jgi:uncharacterized protein (DUF488 family)
MKKSLFTIGHSTHPIHYFIALLKAYEITAVCDVRSGPYSRMNPQFNREDLKKALRENRISYVFMGKELGARSDDLCCYVHGKVQYDLLAQTELFQHGLSRIQAGIEKYRITLMCAEKDPLDCHRTILVSRYLEEKLDLEVQHILANGQLEKHSDTMDRLLYNLKLPSQDIFRTHDVVLADACRIQGQKIAYTLNEQSQGKVERWAAPV